MTQSDKIEAFWNWFTGNDSRIISAIEKGSGTEELVQSLDNLILDIGAFAWEIGPGSNKPWSLTISPNENKDLLKISRLIMDDAPELADWEFNYFKPAKDWDRRFIVYDEMMNQQEVDASNWNFVALKHHDEMVELILEASNIHHLDKETALTAANLVVMSELGEEIKINKITSVDIVLILDEQYADHRTSIQNLREHFPDF